MGFRSIKIIKRKGRWNKKNFKVVGYTFVCTACGNVNREPMRNTENIPYCTSCLVKYGTFTKMIKRKIEVPKQRGQFK